MIKINYNLFQYCVATLFSRKFEAEIISPAPDFPINQPKPFSNRLFSPFIRLKSSFSSFKEITDDNFLQELEKPALNSNLLINGHFQSSVFIKGYQNEIRSCFPVAEASIEGVLVQYRLGDLLQPPYGRVAKLEYFQHCLRQITAGKNMPCYVVSDSLNHPYIAALSNEFNLIPINKTPKEDLLFGAKLKYKVLSLGTFAWWIGFLGNPNDTIYHPDPDKYFKWHGDIFCFDNWNKI
jgi:hypothetical protein